MKTLLLLRHGKSDWDASYGGDHQRPLASRGIRSARLMGRVMSAMDLVPDQVISSTAIRASATATLASEAGGWDVAPSYEDGLYGAGPDAVLALASRATADRVMLVGHQPTWSMLVRELTGASVEIKTASLAVIDLLIDDWLDLPGARGTLSLLLHPRPFFGSEWDIAQ